MAKLNNYSTWLQAGIGYWGNQIDSEVESRQSSIGYSNAKKEQIRSEMKADLTSYMNDIETKAVMYENDDSKRNQFVSILLSAGTYIIAKDIAATPEAPVEQISSLPNNDLRDLFAWWLIDFVNYESLFTIYLAMESTDPEDPLAPNVLNWEFQKNASYDSQLADFDGYSDDDIGRFNTFVEQSANSQMSRAAYLMFAGANAIVVQDQTTDLKTKILVDYHAQDILDKFGWTVKGLNA